MIKVDERVEWTDNQSTGVVVSVDDYIRIQWDDGRLGTYKLDELRIISLDKKTSSKEKIATSVDKMKASVTGTSDSFRRFADILAEAIYNNRREDVARWARHDTYEDERFNNDPF